MGHTYLMECTANIALKLDPTTRALHPHSLSNFLADIYWSHFVWLHLSVCDCFSPIALSYDKEGKNLTRFSDNHTYNASFGIIFRHSKFNFSTNFNNPLWMRIQISWSLFIFMIYLSISNNKGK